MTSRTLDSPLLGDGSPLDARQKSVVERVSAKERAGILALPTDDPLDPERRRRVDATRGEMLGQPEAIRATWARNTDTLPVVAERVAAKAIDRVFLVGAGDSLAVMIAARRTLELMLGVPCEPVQALEFAYYQQHLVTSDSLVIALSSSGETTRTVEALLVAQHAGALTLAVTNTAGSTLDVESENTLLLSATRVGWPTQSSTTALSLLLRLATAVGCLRGAADAESLSAELETFPGLVDDVLRRLDAPVAEIARIEASRSLYLFSAGGPNWAAAIIGAAKVKETSPDHAIEIQVEEFHHYNSQKPGEPMFLFAPSGPSVARAVDTGRDAHRYGGTLYVATSEGESAFDEVADGILRLPAVSEALSPLLYLLPAQLIGYHLGMAKFDLAEAAAEGETMSEARSLVCVGNLTIDQAVHDGVLSVPAMGGDAAYAALAARLLLDDVSLLAPVGDDLPDAVLDDLSAAGVGTADLPRRPLPTVRNTVTYGSDGSRVWQMHATETEFDALSVYPRDVPPRALEASGLVLSAMSLESQLALTPWLRENTSAALYLDLQEDYLDGNREALLALVGLVDVFLPSEVEAVALAETTDLVEAARFFASFGPTAVVIKRAGRGSLVLAGGVVSIVETEKVDPVDSTGAGDAFCGAFAAHHLLHGDPVEAARAGSNAARIAISDFGIAGLLKARREVLR